MEYVFKKGNRYEKLLTKIKKELRFESTELETIHEVIGEGAFVATVKYDGELTAAVLDGDKLITYNRHGRLRWDYPALTEYAEILLAQGHRSAIFFCELYAVSPKGRPLPLNETASILKKPVRVVDGVEVDRSDQMRLAMFDVYELDGERIYGRAPYPDRFLLVNEVFKGGHRVHPVAGRDFKTGDKVLDQLWKKHVLDENYEGLVIRANGAVKIKPKFSIDLAVVGIYEGKGRHEGALGGFIGAFLDREGRFLYAARPGTGLTDEERMDFWDQLYPQVVQEGKFFGRKNTLLVVPELVIEVIGTSFIERDVEAMVWNGEGYEDAGLAPGWTIQLPRFIRVREDKTVNEDDLRLEQVPVLG